ncbi:uncharacterized protein LOC9298536 [Arabidopsis lyrata subsp. lyrata]|nr:uncharacterized protein LOC9298536 [Arabidopsis lyrata subsp. lyrata]|eukprot:XP_020890983.1 uncharacterized protein LOC9298536 [Arabidopsis lyrata subsp. lyrata]
MAHWRFLRGLFSPAGDEPPYAGRMATVADFCLRRFDQRLNTSQSHHIRKAREVSTLFLSIWSMIFLVFLLLKVSSLIFHREGSRKKKGYGDGDWICTNVRG